MADSLFQRRCDTAGEALSRENGLQSLIQSHAAVGGALGGAHKQPTSYDHYKKSRKFCCTDSHGDFSSGEVARTLVCAGSLVARTLVCAGSLVARTLVCAGSLVARTLVCAGSL